jgi:hypothetical protein
MASILNPTNSLGRSKGPALIQTGGKSIYSKIVCRNIYKGLDTESLVGKMHQLLIRVITFMYWMPLSAVKITLSPLTPSVLSRGATSEPC